MTLNKILIKKNIKNQFFLVIKQKCIFQNFLKLWKKLPKTQ